MRGTLDERFFSKVWFTDGCWLWIGAMYSNGYGHFATSSPRKDHLAHRFAYERLVGSIPVGLTLDHLCRNRACVRPDHLEPVTQEVNNRRGMGASGRHFRATHCPKGHPYDGENLYIRPDGMGRGCKECRRESVRVRQGTR